MKVLIFGTGQYYEQYAFIIYKYDEVVGLLDNNSDKWGRTIDGVKVYSPDDIPHIQYDKIILLSVHDIEMHKQLIAGGVSCEKVMYWKQYYYARFDPPKHLTISSQKPLEYRKRILIITTSLNYNGGTLTAIYAARALTLQGCYVVIAAPDANEDFLKEPTNKGMNFILYERLPYVKKEHIAWIQEFDVVIVNVLQMIQCACEISQIKPVLWWIHECGEKYECIYSDTLLRFNQYANEKCFQKVHIYAVSDIAKKIFKIKFTNASVGILPYGIPDERRKFVNKNETKLIFAVVGYCQERKGQDIFIEAIARLKGCVKKKAEYWIIGKIPENDFGNKIREMASKDSMIKIWGEMNREQMREIYNKIDIIVCPSREETMSIVVTEGMMYGKPCIVSDNTGMAEYIVDGENGVICKAGDCVDLSLKMKWCLENTDVLQSMGDKARLVYENFFTLEKFGERLKTEIVSEVGRDSL